MALQKKVDKWKLKKWFTVYAPKEFNNVVIGEMPANEDKDAIGRTVKVGLDTITHNPSHAYTNVKFKVVSIDGTAAHTKLVVMEQLNSYIRSLVRRYRSIASTVQKLKTKDNVEVVAKLIAITRNRTTHSKIRGIRKEMEAIVASYINDNDMNAIISTINEGKLQSDIAARLNHIASINRVEVKKLEVNQ
jgi:small subunit ribosomal protein S3Ae